MTDPELQRLNIENIHEPTREEKLHPEEKEKPEEWAEFKDSIGSEPNKPLEVVRKNGHFEHYNCNTSTISLSWAP